MSKMTFTGPWRYRISGYATLMRLSITTAVRHLTGRRLDPSWGTVHEIGIRFWRDRFTRAMTMDISEGRRLFDAVQTRTGLEPQLARTPAGAGAPPGFWVTPAQVTSPATLLYFHGGGYAFDAWMTDDFAALLAEATGARLFRLDYRLTPEHPDPAQRDDALAAVRWMLEQVPPERLVLVGDSAGGHMALRLLLDLREAGLGQPALCIGLCPWTDIGARGESLYGNDRYDMVQGWMALQFGRWLDPEGLFGRAALSPVAQDFAGLAPIYLQTGGREILHDMIRDFAEIQAGHGADVMLDVWPTMPHDFQLYDSLEVASTAALERIARAVRWAAGEAADFGPGAMTARTAGRFFGA